MGNSMKANYSKHLFNSLHVQSSWYQFLSLLRTLCWNGHCLFCRECHKSGLYVPMKEALNHVIPY